jgi:glycosyltransferase involved in cell wall biosynthesis
MTIIHLSTPRTWRGGEQQLLYLAGELERARVRQVLFCPEGSVLGERYKALTGRRPVTFHPGTPLNLSALIPLSALVQRVPDPILHTHDSHANTIAWLAARFFGIKAPVVVGRKVDFPVGRSWFSRRKYNYSSVARIVCVSERIREIMEPAVRDRSKLIVVHDGVDPDRFPERTSPGILRREYHLPAEAVLAGNVAAIAPHKDYFTFVDTAEILCSRHSSLRFFIIGDGPQRTDIENYIRRKNLGERIIMTGFREDLPEILPELDIFLMTSKTEGLGSSILDAYLCRVPVVATAAGGIPEIVTDGETGLLAPVQNAAALADAVERLLDNPGLREKLVEGASLRVKGFTKEVMAGKMMQIYTEVSG